MRKCAVASVGQGTDADSDALQCIYVLSVMDGCRYKLVTRGDVRQLSVPKIKRYLAANTGLPIAAQELTLNGRYLSNEASSSKELLYHGAVLQLRVMEPMSCGVTSSCTSASTRASSMTAPRTQSEDDDSNNINNSKDEVDSRGRTRYTNVSERSSSSCAAWESAGATRQSGSEMDTTSCEDDRPVATTERHQHRDVVAHGYSHASMAATPPHHLPSARRYEDVLSENEWLHARLRTMRAELRHAQNRLEQTTREEDEAICRSLRERVAAQESVMATMQQRVDALLAEVREEVAARVASEAMARELRAELATLQSRQDPRADSPPPSPRTTTHSRNSSLGVSAAADVGEEEGASAAELRGGVDDNCVCTADVVRSMMVELERELHASHIPLEDIHDTRCFTLHRSSDGTEREVLHEATEEEMSEKDQDDDDALSRGGARRTDAGEQLTLMATYDAQTQRLYLYASVLHMPHTSDTISAVLTPEQRLQLYECLLEGSLLGKEMVGGGVGLSREEGIVLMSTSVDVRHSDMRALAVAARPFVEAVRGWKSVVQHLLAAQQQPAS